MKINKFFKPGKLTTLMDGGAGSSGKGKMGSYVTENADNWTFACNAFAPQAGHWVRLDSGKQYFYQTLNSCAYNTEKYEKLYIGAGSTIELPALFRELEENGVPRSKLGISPMAAILEPADAAYERGEVGFDNDQNFTKHDGTIKHGSTCHGCGSVAARRVLRKSSLRLARDIPELKEFLCDVQGEITARLDSGQSGLLELAQGFQLSLLNDRFFPNTTSRQVTVAQGLSDMFLPTRYAGPVIVNLRTYPIRINSNKYVALDDGRFITQNEIDSGVPHRVIEGNSGAWYPDQQELTWDTLTKISGSPTKIREITSVTKLARRVATFSQMNLEESLKYNDTGDDMYLSINFANYVDNAVAGCSTQDGLSKKFYEWINTYIPSAHMSKLALVGTGMKTSETILID